MKFVSKFIIMAITHFTPPHFSYKICLYLHLHHHHFLFFFLLLSSIHFISHAHDHNHDYNIFLFGWYYNDGILMLYLWMNLYHRKHLQSPRRRHTLLRNIHNVNKWSDGLGHLFVPHRRHSRGIPW